MANFVFYGVSWDSSDDPDNNFIDRMTALYQSPSPSATEHQVLMKILGKFMKSVGRERFFLIQNVKYADQLFAIFH